MLPLFVSVRPEIATLTMAASPVIVPELMMLFVPAPPNTTASPEVA
jgi:hypothetical protein